MLLGDFSSVCKICAGVAVVPQTPSQGADILTAWSPNCCMKWFLLG